MTVELRVTEPRLTVAVTRLVVEDNTVSLTFRGSDSIVARVLTWLAEGDQSATLVPSTPADVANVRGCTYFLELP